MLLRESGVDVDQGLVRLERDGVEAAADWASLGSPENYVRYGRAVGFASPGGVVPDEPHVYSPPTGCGAIRPTLSPNRALLRVFRSPACLGPH
jgi:hypothetical protein